MATKDKAKQLPTYKVIVKKLSELKDHPSNPRTIRDTALKGLVASLEEFGLIQPIIWNKRTGYIVGGHQRKKALEAAGYKSAQVLVVDYDERKETGALVSLNNERIQGEWDSQQAHELIVNYEMLYPDQSRELMLHDLKMDLADGEPGPDDLAQQDPIYSTDQIIDSAFAYYRKAGFPYQSLERHVALQQINRLSALPADIAVRSNAAYHVADTYNVHRYEGRVAGKKSLIEHFSDDVWLRKALATELELSGSIPTGFFGMLALAKGAQALANFRPGFAMALYRRYAKEGGNVLDPCTGYGGRLVGWFASRVGGKYIGVDPNAPTCAANRKMISELGFEGAHIIQKPFEDSLKDIQKLLDGKNSVDFSFTSPPYFSKEKYSEDDTQSWVRYKTIDSWVQGFLYPMFEINRLVLKRDAVFAVNIADVNIGGKTIPLENLTVEAGEKAGFKLEETQTFELSHGPGSGSESFNSDETVFIFRNEA